jgi:23S rRNA (uracil1939-C5)-methyltransferase
MAEKVTLRIAKTVNGGYGLAYLPSGQVVLARHALPGETVTVTIEESKKKLMLGKAAEILSPHPGRTIPPCPYYGECGGCDLQHCQYSTQLKTKKSILEDLLQRQPGLDLRDKSWPLREIIGSPQQFGYRQRIKLQLNDRSEFGFYRYRSHDVVVIKQCLLAAGEINLALKDLRAHPLTGKLKALAREVEIQLDPATQQTISIFHLRRKPRPADFKTAERLCKDIAILESIFFSGKGFPLTGPCPRTGQDAGNMLTCTYPGMPGGIPSLDYRWEVGGFFQVNTGQNSNLITTVVALADIHSDDRVLDLFCGMGNFSISLAFLAKDLMGIEGQGSAIRSARANASQAGLKNTVFRKENVHTSCRKLVEQGESFDVVVIDPPREGVPDLAELLFKLVEKRLVYVSCDPATLCRDLAGLTGAGFHVGVIQPVDMFPQTHHLETIVCLTKPSI